MSFSLSASNLDLDWKASGEKVAQQKMVNSGQYHDIKTSGRLRNKDRKVLGEMSPA
jgi:hypothetical protein